MIIEESVESMNERYGMPAEYRPNRKAVTIESEEGDYWTSERIGRSAVFQYHVYQLARRWIKNRSTRLLDVGSGPGVKLAELLAPYVAEIVCADQPSVERVLLKTLPQAKFVPMNLEEPRVHFEKPFDVVMCVDVLEHLHDPDPCIELIYEALSPSGVAIISTPERKALRGRDCFHCPKAEHVREWRKAEFANYLKSRGFTILQHLCMPGERVSNWKADLSMVTSRVLSLPGWHACQAVVCRAS